MNDEFNPPIGHANAAGPHKRPWTTPTLRRMKAGDAEVGTRATGDGAFTTS